MLKNANKSINVYILFNDDIYEKKKQRRLQIIEHKLQKVKDKNLLKNWRNMYRRRSHEFVRKASNPSSGPVLPGNSVAKTAPFGMGKNSKNLVK